MAGSNGRQHQESTLRSRLFWAGLELRHRGTLEIYHHIDPRNQTADSLHQEQAGLLEEMIRFAATSVPYYENMFERLGLSPDAISTPKDLERLAILTRADIKRNPEDFFPAGHSPAFSAASTGGSTGEPLKYRLDTADQGRAFALLFRMWERAGYRPGDRMAIVAGWSLVSTDQPARQWLADRVLNWRHYSSFGMTDSDIDGYLKSMARWRPRFIRGYASSLHLLAERIAAIDFAFGHDIKAIFSTSEMLTQQQRVQIESAFGAPIFDQYGLNDGGVTAWECGNHDGKHVDMERAILEVVDDAGRQIVDEPGRVLATSLHNYSMPFIRYDTGDTAILSSEPCICGDPKPLLKQLLGRATDAIHINGHYIGSPVLTVLMGTQDVGLYQIEQTGPDELTVRLQVEDTVRAGTEMAIRDSLVTHLGSVDIRFEDLAPELGRDGAKHRFIINSYSATGGSPP